MRTRIAVIGGGQNCEHEVSLASAAAAAAALDPVRHDVLTLTIGLDGGWHDEAGPIALGAAIDRLQTCDVALPLVHGPRGEDGSLAALCELAGVRYIGSGVRAGALAMDKWVTKLVAEAHGIATARGVLLTPTTAPTYCWSGPVVVKPVAAGSSKGVALVRDEPALRPALDDAFALDDRVLVEEVLIGREIDLAVLGTATGRVVAPALEIVVSGFFDFDTKYDGSAEFVIPAPVTATELKELETAALTLYDALGCAGVARIDFFLTESGPVLNEVNTVPGFTAASQVPKMFAACGIDYPALLEILVVDALGAAQRGQMAP